MSSISHDFYKNLGFTLLDELRKSLKERGQIINDQYGYATLLLPNKMKIRFTPWRKGTMPYYIILFDQADKYIFELDLSMIVYEDDLFSWNLKKPTNDINQILLEVIFGSQKKFTKVYSSLVKNTKKELKSGIKGANQGYLFVNNLDLDSLVENLVDLMRSVISAHTQSSEGVSTGIFIEAKNDNDVERGLKKIRRNQSQFRLNLIKLYGLKCMISGMDILEVIDAAHIISHSDSGVNHTNNGLLLRSDLHKLFDANLIRINPKTLKVKISKRLKQTEYFRFDGVKISSKIDGSYLDNTYLIKKWNEI